MTRLLTVSEVAERLRIHPMTVRRHIKSGRLRALRVGRRIRIPEDAIEAPATSSSKDWLADLLRPHTPEELDHRRAVGEEMKRLRALVVKEAGPGYVPGPSSDVLIRAGRRFREVTGNDKTFEELIAEESRPLGD